MEATPNSTGPNSTGQNSSGWHRDPWRRFEYRYFNGVQWTSDVAINGQRYVDAPVGQLAPQVNDRRPPRGKAITSMVTALSAIAVGWIPFIVVFAAGAAIASIVFGILGLRAARRHDGYGRRFAVAGLALSPIAIAVCVGGFFLTALVVREFRDSIEPGPHELFVQQPCTIDDGRATLTGTIRNLDDHDHGYRIVVEFDGANNESRASTVDVPGVGAGETSPWTSSVGFSGESVDCRVTEVLGPAPFGIDDQG